MPVPMAAAGRAPHPLFLFLFLFMGVFLPTSRGQPPRAAEAKVTVGLIIDAASPVGKIASTTIPMALDDFYATYPNSSTRVQVLTHDSGGDVVAAASAALQLMTSQGARAILGPQSSVESAFVADLATRAEVPVVSFSATSPSMSPAAAGFFVRAALSDAAQAGAIAALADYFGWRRVVPIYQDDDYGAAFVPYLVDALTAASAEVPYRCALPAAASRDAVTAAMYRLKSEQTRAFVVHARPALAELVLTVAEEAGMMAEGYAWVITDGLTGLLGSVRPPQGVIGLVPYVPSTLRLRNVKRRWAQKFMNDHRDADAAEAEMGCYALWAYDAAWAVASAAERLNPGDLLPPGLVGGRSGPADFSWLGKSSSGKKFLTEITSSTFDGLAGRFQLVNGELTVPAFRVVNIVDNANERSIGFWTPEHGLTRRLSSGASGSNGGLGPVIWPGDSTVVPSGWVQPTSGRKLHVAVPGKVDSGYRPIVHIDVDPATNRTVAGGYVIEVFEAAVRLLPYALPFEYVPVPSMLYDSLIKNVNLGVYDAAVGDITITANRSQLVDFTLPFMSSGISIVVPVRDQRSKRAWVFLKPLRYDLWLVSFAFFLFTGFAVWALEHRVNDEFRGPPSYQIGTLLYFGFSTLVFAHRENLRSNLSRFAVVVWVFVVLILQSSYTASLTSMLTVPQLEPTIADYSALCRGTDKVGVLSNSFLRRSMVTNPSCLLTSRLASYRSTQSFHEALLNGTIGAIVDEKPYLRLFLKTYCDNFTMTRQTNKTGGFGFAFPKGSPYVADLSRAILNLTESDELSLIERKWFGHAEGCAAQSSPFTSASLSFGSFWGLFLITGATSLSCCAVHLATFIVANRRPIWELASASHVSWRGRFRRFLKLFDDKDLSAHTFRTKDAAGGGSVAGRSSVDAGASPAVTHNGAGSPISVSNHTYMSELSLGTASPAPADGIELTAEDANVTVARNPDGISDQNGKGHHQASN